jgi:hypothetical protein
MPAVLEAAACLARGDKTGAARHLEEALRALDVGAGVRLRVV